MDEKHPIVPRDEEKTKQIQHRLRRIEGQVRGIQQMVADDRYCTDILVQISAANKALKKVGLEVLEHHTEHCMTHTTEEDKGEAMDDLFQAIRQFSKT